MGLPPLPLRASLPFGLPLMFSRRFFQIGVVDDLCPERRILKIPDAVPALAPRDVDILHLAGASC